MKKLRETKLEIDEDLENIKYAIDLNDDSHRSVALIIADRRDYAVKQSSDLQNVLGSNLKELVKDISVQAIDSPEYLLPDMPLKEAVFRAVIANKNKQIFLSTGGGTIKDIIRACDTILPINKKQSNKEVK